MQPCPYCGGLIEVRISAASVLDPEYVPASEPEEWLAPCQLADRLGIGEAYARKLIKRGLAAGLSGFDRRGGRLFATVEALTSLWGG